MLPLVLDTNVLVAGLRSNTGASYQLVRMLPETRFRLNISVALALEYEDVLKRPGQVTGMSAQELDNILNYILAMSNLEPYVPRLRPSLRDPDDERILEVAVQCGATVVTHNLKDFEGAAQFGITVKTPSEMLRILRNKL